MLDYYNKISDHYNFRRFKKNASFKYQERVEIDDIWLIAAMILWNVSLLLVDLRLPGTWKCHCLYDILTFLHGFVHVYVTVSLLVYIQIAELLEIFACRLTSLFFSQIVTRVWTALCTYTDRTIHVYCNMTYTTENNRTLPDFEINMYLLDTIMTYDTTKASC